MLTSQENLALPIALRSCISSSSIAVEKCVGLTVSALSKTCGARPLCVRSRRPLCVHEMRPTRASLLEILPGTLPPVASSSASIVPLAAAAGQAPLHQGKICVVEATASRLEAIVSRLEAVASRLKVVGCCWLLGVGMAPRTNKAAGHLMILMQLSRGRGHQIAAALQHLTLRNRN